MPDQALRIVIEGHTGQGKTSLALMVVNTLKKAGFDVTFRDEELPNVVTQEWFDEYLARKLQPHRIETLARRIGVLVETRQLNRVPHLTMPRGPGVYHAASAPRAPVVEGPPPLTAWERVFDDEDWE